MSLVVLQALRSASRSTFGRCRHEILLPLLSLAAMISGGTAQAADVAVKSFAVETIRNVAYYEGVDAHAVKHRLDLYLPKGQKGFPVLLFVHGGAWQIGDKNQFGSYSALGHRLARHGIGLVSINYRLSPAVQHPEHIKDVARAFAWTHHNISKYGGRRDEIFVGGHSAGGHLAALLATDGSYLEAEGLSRKAISGVLPISGVYTIPEGAILDRVFGKGTEGRKQASPITHVCPGTPPFLIFYADKELPGCEGAGAAAFCKALRAKECVAENIEIKDRNHLTILWKAATEESDPVAQAMMNFIVSNVTVHRLGVEPRGAVDFLAKFIARSAAPR